MTGLTTSISQDPTRPAPGAFGVRERAGGFLSTFGRVRRRLGWRGVAELLLARTAPRLLAYQRTTLIDTPLVGSAHPELDPRRVVSPEPTVNALFDRLAQSGEPEVPSFSRAMVHRRFAAGQELWLFFVEGEVAHARWIVRDALRFANVSIPLPDGYCATEAAVTLADYRGRQLHASANHHVRAVMGENGARGMLSAMNGLNRGLLAWSVSPDGGAHTVATVHVLTVAGRSWLRVLPASSPAPQAIEAPGPRSPDAPMAAREPHHAGSPGTCLGPGGAAGGKAPLPRSDHGSRETRRPCAAAGGMAAGPGVGGGPEDGPLEEGVTGDELLFTLARRARAAAGVDISEEATALARATAARANVAVDLRTAGLESLPFEDEVFDAVVSTSTLDHIPQAQRLEALIEVRRVLAPGGVLVITCDNAENAGDRLLGLCARLGMVPFPLEAPVSLDELRELVARAGFAIAEHAFLVPGPRVLTTLAVRLARPLGGERGVEAVISRLEDWGRRWPRRMGAFVAVRAVARDPAKA